MLVDLKSLPQYHTATSRMAQELLDDNIPLQQLIEMREAQSLLGTDDLIAHAWVDALDRAIEIIQHSASA